VLTIFNDQVDHVLSHVAIAAFERLTYPDINQMVEPLLDAIKSLKRRTKNAIKTPDNFLSRR
jgi:hypothetical protein